MDELDKKLMIINKITDEDILKAFFEKNNISFLIEEFKEQKAFSPDVLKELTDNDLEKLGVTTLGDRKRILKLFLSNDYESFRIEFLCKDLSSEERARLNIPENRILKQNTFRRGGGSVFNEKGKLTLYENRIKWESPFNNFIIPINKIVDVSIKNGFGCSVLKITDDIAEHKFYTVNRVSGALVGAGIAGNNLLYLGLAAMNDKPMTDIEHWRFLIEKLRERNPAYHGARGINNREGCLVAFIVGTLGVLLLSIIYLRYIK